MTEHHAAAPGRPIGLPLTAARIHAYRRDGITPTHHQQRPEAHNPFYATELGDVNLWTPSGPRLIAYSTDFDPLDPHARARDIAARLNHHLANLR